MKKVGIIGGAGYTAGELIRILVNHQQVNLDFVYSTSNAGNPVGKVHGDLAYLDLKFTDTINTEVDVVFLCLGHGNSKTFLAEHTFADHTHIIDLSTDFRSGRDTHFRGKDFVYGLPPLNKEAITEAQNVANPGCFATAIQLGLLPLAKAGLLTSTVHCHAVTGATGAGTGLSPTTHFSWRDNNFSYYKPFVHQHLTEIKASLSQLQGNTVSDVLFLPHRGNFSRGIFATAYLSFDGDLEEATALFHTFYTNDPFVKVVANPIHLKQVVNTNYAFIHIDKIEGQLLITCTIDNLLKGASGQAIENMNLMFDWKQTEGLQLKANYF